MARRRSRHAHQMSCPAVFVRPICWLDTPITGSAKLRPPDTKQQVRADQPKDAGPERPIGQRSVAKPGIRGHDVIPIKDPFAADHVRN